MTQLPLRSPLDPPPREHVPPAFTPEPQQRRAIRRPAVYQGESTRVETSDILGEEGNPKHPVRFRSRLSPIDSDSDSESDEEGPKPEAIPCHLHSGSNPTLREAHEEARRRKEAAALIDKSPPSTSPEETKFTFTAALPAESRTWNELSSVIPRRTSPNLNLQPFSPVSVPPTSTFGRRALTDSSPEILLFANSCLLSGSFLTLPLTIAYTFAILLGGCRQIMRSGAMWFIKDPQNQNMHPIRDILERPTFTHLCKLFQSAIMYALVVVETKGTVFDCSMRPGVYAPHPSLHHPLLPASNSRSPGWYRPVEVAFKEAACLVEPRREGGWRRVPANDNVAIVRGVRATVEVAEDGQPINEAEARLLKLQNAEAERHNRNVDEDYAIVYIPPHFKYRIVIFILAVWSVCCIAIAAMLAGPVLLGRRFFLLFTVRQVHDGYSFVVGFHLLWGCWLVTQAIDRLDRHRQRRENGSRAWWPLSFTKHNSLWLARPSYIAFFLVFVTPTLIALVEIYVLLPIKLVCDSGLITLQLLGIEAPQRMNEGIRRVNRKWWSCPDPMTTRDAIGPAVGGLLAILAFSVGTLWMFRLLINYRITDRALFARIYP
ncbi:hypothetical protein BDM02DRAFT_3190340 [Thelephora ganbajun]|uniref:Uncharacterized protein n=1 Tax=Thelephora ganbajun TaxID=370292 RepID=A0ACB6Z4Y0_THEGA|nr:hypothetical protein BDM02DRAFT_3190340 [Thelephora ganbajun]